MQLKLVTKNIATSLVGVIINTTLFKPDLSINTSTATGLGANGLTENGEDILSFGYENLTGIYKNLTITASSPITGDFKIAVSKMLPDYSYNDVALITASFANSTTFTVDISTLDFSPVANQSVVTLPVAVGEPTTNNADKLKFSNLQLDLRLGKFINDNDSVFMTLGGNSALAAQVMTKLDAGEGYTGLKQLGLTDATCYKVLAIYNVKQDTGKYESEKALELLANDFTKLISLQTFLANMNLTMPPLDSYIAALRADHQIYSAVRTWQQSLVS